MSDQTTTTSAPEKGPVPEVSANVRLIQPKNNLIAFANVSIGGHFAINDIPVKTGKNGIFFDNPAKPDGRGGYSDVCLPTSKEMREAITAAITDAYGLKMEKHQAIGDAQKEVSVRPSIKEKLQEGKEAAAAQAPAVPKDGPKRDDVAI